MMIAAAGGYTEDGEHHDAHSGAEKAAIDGCQPLEDQAR